MNREVKREKMYSWRDRRLWFQILILSAAINGGAERAEAVVIGGSGDLASAAALANTYEGVGWVEIAEGSSTFRGTGVLIDEEWVLTAGHNWLADEVTDLTFHIGGTSYSAQSGAWHQHPGWVANPEVSPTQGWDLGLFRLSSAVSGVTPVSLYGGSSELGTTVTVLGSGLAGTAATGPRFNTVPTLYAATNVIDRVIGTTGSEGAGGLLTFDFDDGSSLRNSLAGSVVYDTVGQPVNILGEASVTAISSLSLGTAMEGTSAAGDSGGPAFADFGNGPEVVGLVSWGVNPTDPSNLYGSDYGDVTYLTRVSAFDEWIYATIPEPGTGVLILIALSFCWGRRRGWISEGCGRSETP